MRRMRVAAAILLVACGLLAVVIVTAGHPTSASAAATPAPPNATTGSASNQAQSSATVSGTVNPEGTDTQYYFQYGTSTAYGAKTTATDAGAGTADVPVSANLTGLTPNTTYHYQLVAVSSAGTTTGADQTFTTTNPPVVTTTAASNATHSSATFNGTVNPQGQSTTYYFRYGTTTSYGLQTSPSSAGSGTGVVAVNAHVTGLTSNTVYHYQLVAQNAGGTSYGNDETVTTTASQIVVLGHEGFVSPGWVVGVELGCFHGTSQCSGHISMTHNGAQLAQSDYSMSPDSGGFHNMVLNQTGKNDLGSNSTFHLLPVTVTVTSSSGQKLSYVIHLARWVWH
jgi:phosphodiesterase/alkaline phosphatase D-like protein